MAAKCVSILLILLNFINKYIKKYVIEQAKSLVIRFTRQERKESKKDKKKERNHFKASVWHFHIASITTLATWDHHYVK